MLSSRSWKGLDWSASDLACSRLANETVALQSGASAATKLNMLLVIDIGNTNTSLGVFDGEKLIAHWRLTTERARTRDEWGVLARNLFELTALDFKSIDAIADAAVRRSHDRYRRPDSLSAGSRRRRGPDS